jgi:uncharacterized protein YciI
MTKRDGLFVKINYNNNGETSDNKINNTSSVAKNKDMNVKKYLLCAGVFNKNGGTMIFQAKNMDEAEQIVSNNPFVGSRTYNYEILKGDVISINI